MKPNDKHYIRLSSRSPRHHHVFLQYVREFRVKVVTDIEDPGFIST